jgi:hypothetical protein
MLGLGALHIADESFIQSQPGTSAGDHLVSGPVPPGGARAGRSGLPALAPGGRAAIALLVGFFGVAFGIEAVYYTTKVGPSGHDFTGLRSSRADRAEQPRTCGAVLRRPEGLSVAQRSHDEVERGLRATTGPPPGP